MLEEILLNLGIDVSIGDQVEQKLDKALQARVAATSEGKNVVYTPPSESEFMAGVAKDMAGEMLSSRTVWIIIAVIVILVIIAVIWYSKV